MAKHRTTVDVRLAAASCLLAIGLDSPTGRRVASTIDRFVCFLEGEGVTGLCDVTHEHAEAFVRSRLDSGLVAALATQHNRRSSLRLLFSVARRLEMTREDPTLDVRLPPASSLPTRPLTDDEVELCRDVAWWASAQAAAAWALAEATARGSEIAEVVADDVDLEHGTVQLPGGARCEARLGSLTEWGTQALRRRIDHTGKGGVAYAGAGSGGQASTCRAISSVLVRAGLAREPDVRPASVAGWAGRRVFDSSGRIEDAARAMGVRSLDRAARLIGLDWASRG